ncbi:MAG: O-antigen ligase family protein [Oscillospiraceae bacterium]|nr:O-antigen ligase family protein [Oscillospiraceae bacterium]
MRSVWNNSIPGRLAAFLALIWPGSLCCKLGQAWQRSREESRILAPFRWLIRRRESREENSFLAEMTTRWNQWLGSRTGLRTAVHRSVPGRIWGWLVRVLSGSRIVGWIFRGGMTGLFVLALALYIPLNFFFRDLQPVALLGTVWDELLLAASLFWIAWMRMDRKTELQARVSSVHCMLTAFLILALAEMFLVSPYWSIAVPGLRATVQYMLWFFVTVSLIRDEKDFLKIYTLIALTGMIIGLHGIYQYIARVPMPSSWMSSSEQSVRTRVFSIFGSPNIMGDFMVMTAPLAAGLFFYVKDWRLKFLSAAATGIMCISCLFTMSRGAWIGLVLAVLVFIAIAEKRLLIAGLIAGVCALFLPFVWSRVSYLFSDEFWWLSTNGGRISRWTLGISYLYRTNPVFGMGLGMYGGAVAVQNRRLPWVFYTYMDNNYLKIFVEMGWVGIIGFALLLLSVIFTGAHICRKARGDRRERALMAGVFASLIGVMAHLAFENIFEEPYMSAEFWILAGLMVWFGLFRSRKNI